MDSDKAAQQSEPFLAAGEGDSPRKRKRVGEAEYECEKDRTAVFIICGVTIVFCLGIGGASAMIFSEQHTNSSLIFLLEMLIDILSSSVVIWRFCPRDIELGNRRENIGQMFLGLIEGAMSIFGMAHCTYGLAVKDGSHLTGSDEHRAQAQIIFAIATGGFFLLTMSKFCLGVHFKSLTLVADAIDSLAGCTMALAVLISQFVSEDQNKKLWYFDHVTGFIMAFAIGCFSIWLLYRRREELKADLHCDCCWSRSDPRERKLRESD